MILDDKNISVIPKFLSDSECEWVISKCLSELNLETASVHKSSTIEYQKNTRKSKVAFVDDLNNINTKITNEILKRIPKQRGYELYVETFQFTEYNIGDYFDWHSDSDDDIYKDRIYTIVVQLNDEYSSGDFQLMLENSITLKPGKGNMFIFPSATLHRVKPVESGKRYSLVSWLKLKKIENNKTELI